MTETEEDWKKTIDSKDYEQLLREWRFAPSELFQGERGQYFSKVMIEKRNALSEGQRTAASKSVGWDK